MQNTAMPIDRRRAIAASLGIGEQYLYQILRGLRTPRPEIARRLVEIEPSIRLRDLRPDDWQQIWPELAESEPNRPAALTQQAQTAINADAQEGIHA